jgi:hypothetical protein
MICKYLAIVMILMSCFEAAGQKKFEFDYPDEATTDSSKKAFVKQFNQGHTLYMMTCSKCHNKMDGKKEIIPDFSLPQLMDYEVRLYPQHQDKFGDDTKLTDEELAKVIAFLRYKKKSGITVSPPPKL